MISGIVTAILLVSFLAGSAWAYSSRRRAEFEALAHAARGGPAVSRRLVRLGDRDSRNQHRRLGVAAVVDGEAPSRRSAGRMRPRTTGTAT
jgi:hypothetical protein